MNVKDIRWYDVEDSHSGSALINDLVEAGTCNGTSAMYLLWYAEAGAICACNEPFTKEDVNQTLDGWFETPTDSLAGA